MPSPFPGMDPFIEGLVWPDFHHEMIGALRHALTPRVRPRYVVRVEERVYVEHDLETLSNVIRPDLTVLERDEYRQDVSAGTATAVAVEPVVLTVPVPQSETETFLTVRDRETMEVTTVIEVLSPGNKHPGSDGRREYLEKRESVLASRVHLVELDLLRGGQRLPTVEPLPLGDYYAFLCRANRRRRADVYAWPLRHPLPPIPIPLAKGDPDVTIDLQSVFAAVYDRAGYDYSLDYRRPVRPPLSDEEATWTQEVVAGAAPSPQ